MSNAQKFTAFLFPTVCKRSLHLELVLKNFSKNCAHTISNGYHPWNSAMERCFSAHQCTCPIWNDGNFSDKKFKFGNQSIWVEKGEFGNIQILIFPVIRVEKKAFLQCVLLLNSYSGGKKTISCAIFSLKNSINLHLCPTGLTSPSKLQEFMQKISSGFSIKE